jgi:cytoskeletal protein RodZ
MPLDTGAVTHTLLIPTEVDMGDLGEQPEAALETALHIGAALKSTRQRLGRSLQDISDATRIKRGYLDAIEELRLEELPSRPFTIGYVRAYAKALGIDGEAAVERFKQDVPGGQEPLRAPVGVRKHKDARLGLLFGGGAVVLTAVVLWNLAQHAMADDTPAPPATVAESPAAPAPAATVAVSPAQPAPADATSPAPYATPGLAAASASSAPASSGAPAASSAPAALASQIDPNPPPTFLAHGAVYGAAAQASTVTLQARKTVSIVVRDAGGNPRFAQVLKAGEAYRAPSAADGLSVDVSNPVDVRVYVNGQLHDDLLASVTPLNKLMAPIAPPAKPLAAVGPPAKPLASAGPPAKPIAAAATPEKPTATE